MAAGTVGHAGGSAVERAAHRFGEVARGRTCRSEISAKLNPVKTSDSACSCILTRSVASADLSRSRAQVGGEIPRVGRVGWTQQEWGRTERGGEDLRDGGQLHRHCEL